jgi:hypothetical protein
VAYSDKTQRQINNRKPGKNLDVLILVKSMATVFDIRYRGYLVHYRVSNNPQILIHIAK